MIKVKPLEWKPYRGGDAEAVALGTIYTAFTSGYWRTQKDPKFKNGGDNLEAAKAAAQAHHDALVLAMIEIPSPQTKLRGTE